MKKILIVLATVFMAIIANVPAFSATRVVHSPGTAPCTTGDFYYNQSEYCCHNYVGAIHNNDPAPDGKAYGPIKKAAIDAAGAEDKIIVCPGTYTDNVSNAKHVESYSQDPTDTIVQAKYPDYPVFYNVRYLSGFTVTGATADATTCTDLDGEHQPCSGYRVYCSPVPQFIKNNIFKGNYIGVQIKDTHDEWPFFVTVENNTMTDNVKGLELYNGHDTTVRNNDIYTNTTGISIINTQNNTITGNNIYDNTKGIDVLSSLYSIKHNRIYQNTILDPVSYLDQVNSSTCPNGGEFYFYHPYLKQGNYWGTQSYSFSCYDPYPLSFSSHFVDDFQDGFDDGWDRGTEEAQFWTVSEYPAATDNIVYIMNPICDSTWQYPMVSLRKEKIITDNMAIKVKAKDDGDNCNKNFRIVFAYDKNTNDVYWAGANIGAGKWVIQKNFEILAATATDIGLQNKVDWFNVDVVIENDTVTLKANGVTKLSTILPAAAKSNLTTGVGGILNHAYFDDFEVIQY